MSLENNEDFNNLSMEETNFSENDSNRYLQNLIPLIF